MKNTIINKFKSLLGKKRNLKSQNKLETLLSERLKKERPIKINEEKIISNVFELPEKLVEDIMIPRTDMISVDANYNINKLIKLIDRTSHSRYPVFEKSRDNIIAMIHIKDVISCSENKRISNIKKLVRKVLFAPHTMNVLDLLLKMRTSHVHMAIIVDEHETISTSLSGTCTPRSMLMSMSIAPGNKYFTCKFTSKNTDFHQLVILLKFTSIYL